MVIEKIDILIIEDESSAINRLQKELKAIRGVEIEIHGIAGSIKDSVKLIRSQSSIDLIFMDIQLTDGRSFEIFNQVKFDTPVIFITAYDEHAVEAFKVNSIDFILKPIVPDDLEFAIKKFRERSSKDHSSSIQRLLELVTENQPKVYRSSFLVTFRQKMLMIDVNDVCCYKLW